MSLYKDASLVMIPSAYKDGKLYSIRPTDGSGDFTFSRGSNLAATRVDVNGLIEKGRENLLLQSNQFDTTWSTSQSSITGSQSDRNGGSDAWLLEATASTSTARLQQGVSISGVHTTSIYAKAGSTNWIAIQMWSNHFAYFDVANGVVGNSGSAIDASIEAAGNGYYRCSLTYNASSVGNIWVYVIDGNGSTAVTSGKNVYLQDAQLEAGLVATDYIETGASTAQAGILEDMPRLDYSGSCPSLLLESQRSNLITQSEYFGGSDWAKTGAGLGSAPIITSNYGTSPEGLNNASRAQFNLNGGTSGGDISYLSFFVSSITPATNSVYLKSLTNDTIMTFRCGSTFKSITITSEWQRFDSIDASGTDRFQLLLYGNSDSQSADILIYGATLEAGSYPTSYIPTYGSSVTRSLDAMYKTGASDLINSSLGTIFIETKFNSGTTTYTERIVKIDDGSGSNQIGFSRYSTNNLNFYLVSGGVTQSDIVIAGEGESYTNMKLAVSYAHNRIKVFKDGVEIGSDTSADMAVGLSRILFGNDTSGNLLSDQDMKQLLFFPTALTDSECIALTTL